MAGLVAFITGAAHGQGRATALALAGEGYHIAAFDIARPLSYPGYTLGSEDELASLKQQVEQRGVRCEIFTGDVRVEYDVTVRMLPWPSSPPRGLFSSNVMRLKSLP